MKSNLKNKQRGVSFLGLLFVGGTLACLGVIGAQVFPTAMEYQAISKAVKKAATGAASPVEVRKIFDNAAAVDNISSISGKELDITKEGDKIVVNFAYERQFHLVGPAHLTLKYAGSSK